MKLMKSFLTEPGSIKYGARTVPSMGIAVRIRLYFLFVAIKSLVLTYFCFFLSQAAFDTNGFVTFNAVASRYVWGLMLGLITALMFYAAKKKNGIVARIGLVLSGMTMVTAGSAFMASAILYNAGWWGAVAYIFMGIMDFLVGSYPGESL